MGELKLTSWNVEHLDTLLKPGESPSTERKRAARRKAIARQVQVMDPDILCVIEGPREERLDLLTHDLLEDRYVAVRAADGRYATLGSQWIWYLVKPHLAGRCSLLPTGTWDEFAGAKWTVHYWGVHEPEQHSHYRHPQVLVLDWFGQRVEFIGLHLKSKFVQRGRSDWLAGGIRRQEFVQEALRARVKLATEAANVRRYIEAKFEQVANPAVFVLGDLNDGPGRELFEREYLFFDLVSNIQGDVFFARRFLNHALFDQPQHLRWSVQFEDFTSDAPDTLRPLLLDHILFTQGLVDGTLPLHVAAGAGLVEHEAAELVMAESYKYAWPSDHRPVSVRVETG